MFNKENFIVNFKTLDKELTEKALGFEFLMVSQRVNNFGCGHITTSDFTVFKDSNSNSDTDAEPVDYPTVAFLEGLYLTRYVSVFDLFSCLLLVANNKDSRLKNRQEKILRDLVNEISTEKKYRDTGGIEIIFHKNTNGDYFLDYQTFENSETSIREVFNIIF